MQDAKIRRIRVPGKPRKKSLQDMSTEEISTLGHTSVIPAIKGSVK
jgi:hypothetical protein